MRYTCLLPFPRCWITLPQEITGLLLHKKHRACLACGPPGTLLGRTQAQAPRPRCCLAALLAQVRRVLLEESRKRFSRVRQVPVLQYGPKALQLEYVDIWELQL